MARCFDVPVAFRTTGRGVNMLLSSVGAYPRYIWWNKVSSPTCLSCGCKAFLLREASGIT